MGEEEKKSKKSKSKESKKRRRQEHEGEEEFETKIQKKIRQDNVEEAEKKNENALQTQIKDDLSKDDGKQINISKSKKKSRQEKEKEQEQTSQKKRKQKRDQNLSGHVDQEANNQEKKAKKSKKSKHKQRILTEPEEAEQKAEIKQPIQQQSQSKEAPKPSKKKSAKKIKGQKSQIKSQQQIQKPKEQQVPQQHAQKTKKQKPKLSKKPEKVKSINVQNLQLSKQCVTEKSNFYIKKQLLLKQGLPVGPGSKKALEKMEQQRKKKLNQRSKKKKADKSLDESEKIQVKQEDQQVNEKEQSVVSKDKSSLSKQEPKKKKDECTTQQSIRIINVYAIDAGDYRGMIKQLPDIPQLKIRGHLRMLFQRCLDIITKRVQETGRKISDWQIMEKREIVRELHRIRCTNRLLSQQNVQFREKFLKLMMSYNDPSITLTDSDFNYLYRKLQAFVRGFCSIGTAKKKTEVKIEDSFEENRKPLLEGGYIMDRNRVKKEVKIQQKVEDVEQKKIDPQKIILEWTQQEQKQLGNLYILHQANAEAIHQQIKIKFGFKNRWKDFQLLNKKLDHLVKMGLYKLQELTSRPYNRELRILQQQEKNKQPVNQTDPNRAKADITSLDLMTKFIYNNKKVVVNKPEDIQEGGIFKNLALLERQIFGHVESFKSRFALVKLLAEKFPPEEQIEEAIQIIKQFVAYAIKWEKTNHILLLKQDPVLEQDAKKSSQKSKTKDDQEHLEQEDKDRINSLAEELEKVQSLKRQFSNVQSMKSPADDPLETNEELNLFQEGQDIDDLMRAELQQ